MTFKQELRKFLEQSAGIGSLSELYDEDGTPIDNGYTCTYGGYRVTVGFSFDAHKTFTKPRERDCA